MKLHFSVLFAAFLTAQFMSALSDTSAFDFFYFVQQWPGAYCDSQQSCCFPTTGKPAADFSIHGLWPNYNDGSYPSNCDPDTPFDESKVTDLISRMQKNWPTLACPSGDGIKFWTHEWEKHGTCSESILDEHSYFESALTLKTKASLLKSLTSYIQCNTDSEGNSQLYQVYLCVDTNGSDLMECPTFPRGKCGEQIQFPAFNSSTSS